MKWEKVNLGDCCTKIGSGSTPKGGSTVYIDEGVALIRSQNVYNLSFDYSGLVFINSEAAEKLNGVKIEPNDILLNITGDSVARTCLVPIEVIPARVNQHVSIIRPRKNVLDATFLSYYLASPFMQSFMLGLAVGKGTSRNAMTKDMISNFEIPCPAMAIQKKIASILKSYDDLIENNQKQIKLLEEAAQRLYKEWFVDLRFPGHDGVKVVNGVPEGWKKVRLDEVTSVLKRGISPKYDENGEFTVINQKCIRKNIVDYSESRKQSKKYAEELQLQESDTVVYSTGIGTLGRVGQIYNVYQNSTFDSHVTLVRANKLIGKQFLFWSLKLLQPYLMSLGKGSTNQQELYKSDLAACRLLLPEEYIMNAFERQAQELHDTIAVKTKQISFLREARDRLLPKLMSGEIEV